MENKEKYNRVLSLALEIEGLAVLLQRRGDLINPEIHNILEEKIKILSSLILDKSCESPSAVVENMEDSTTDSSLGIDTILITPVIDSLKSEQTDNSSDSSYKSDEVDVTEHIKEDQIMENIVLEEIEKVEHEDDMKLAEAVLLEQEEDSDPSIELETESEDIKEDSIEKSSEQTNAADDIVSEDLTQVTPPEVPRIDAVSLMKAFTLNDRFRFRRSLFNDKDEDFKNALLHLSQMNSEEEIEEYLVDDLCLNLEDEDARDFYSVVVAKIFEK